MIEVNYLTFLVVSENYIERKESLTFEWFSDTNTPICTSITESFDFNFYNCHAPIFDPNGKEDTNSSD